MTRLTVAGLAVIGFACSRPPAASDEQAGGLELHQVKFQAWKAGAPTVSGRAPQVSLRSSTFEATDVKLEVANGSRIDTPTLQGELDARNLSASNGGIALTKDGCVAKTSIPSHYDGTTVRVPGDVALDGCGIALNAKGLTYAVAAHQADLDGPVQTRIEAQK